MRTPNGQRRHEVVVDQLVAHGWRRRGLREYLRWRAGEAVRDDWEPSEDGADGDDEWAAIADAMKRIGRVPDAWRVVEEGAEQGWTRPVEVIEFAEVEVTHALPPEKRLEYAWLWARADACDTLALRVWGFDVNGHQYPELASFADYYQTLSLDASMQRAAA